MAARAADLHAVVIDLLHCLDILWRCWLRCALWAGVRDDLSWAVAGDAGVVVDAAQTGAHWPHAAHHVQTVTALWIAVGLAFFTILFGTRKLDVNERHDGVVMAIAVEAVVKLVALLAVGVFVVWGLSGGIAPMLEKIDASEIGTWNVSGGRWAGLTFLSAVAFICLPRMFHVMVVENDDERHLRTASWAFPAYLMLMSLFVLPIAVTGLDLLPQGSNPDMFVLTVPLSQGQNGLAMLSFLGGFSSATSMVIVATIALSTMVSNHIVMPIWLYFTGGGVSVSGDVRYVVLLARRLSIGAIVLLAYFYFQLSGGGSALAAMGLVSFVGVAQALPVMDLRAIPAQSWIGIGFLKRDADAWSMGAVVACAASLLWHHWARSDFALPFVEHAAE